MVLLSGKTFVKQHRSDLTLSKSLLDWCVRIDCCAEEVAVRQRNHCNRARPVAAIYDLRSRCGAASSKRPFVNLAAFREAVGRLSGQTRPSLRGDEGPLPEDCGVLRVNNPVQPKTRPSTSLMLLSLFPTTDAWPQMPASIQLRRWWRCTRHAAEPPHKSLGAPSHHFQGREAAWSTSSA